MNRATLSFACKVLFIALTTIRPGRADGFDPPGFRGVCRDLGVALGPGYHHTPCREHLRRHYNRAVNGEPLPTGKLTPLYLHNGSRMQVSRYAPLEGASYLGVGVPYPGEMPVPGVPYPDLNGPAPAFEPVPTGL